MYQSVPAGIRTEFASLASHFSTHLVKRTGILNIFFHKFQCRVFRPSCHYKWFFNFFSTHTQILILHNSTRDKPIQLPKLNRLLFTQLDHILNTFSLLCKINAFEQINTKLLNCLSKLLDVYELGLIWLLICVHPTKISTHYYECRLRVHAFIFNDVCQ